MNKGIKDKNKLFIKVLLVLLILEVLFIPLLILAEVKKVLPIVAFLIIPTLFAIGVYFLSKNCMDSYEKKKNRIIEKMNIK